MSFIARLVLVVSCIWIGMTPASAFIQQAGPLPAEQAFVVSVESTDAKTLVTKWHTAEGYYLYKDRFKITTEPHIPLKLSLPQGDKKYSQRMGHYETYTGDFVIPATIASKSGTLTLQVHYQGCSDRGFCYPPMHKTLTVTMPQANAAATPNLWKDQAGIQQMLFSKNIFITLLVCAGLGILLAFTPCVLPMIPILTGIIIGQKQPISTRKAFLLSLAYVLGSAITYAVAGMLAAHMGSSLQVWFQTPWMIAAVSGLFLVLALSLFGLYEFRLPNRWHQFMTSLSTRQQGGHYAGVFSMGMLSTLIVSPCVTAPLFGVLLYISETGNMLLGGSALFAMGLGMGVPLLLIGMSAGKFLPKSGSWMVIVKKVFGFLMIAMAIWFSSRIVAPAIMPVLWGAYLIAFATFSFFYFPKYITRRKLSHGFSFMAAFLGVLVLYNGIGAFNQFSPSTASILTMNSPFTVVRNANDIKQQIMAAQHAGKPILLDFYADWCESCVSMDKHVFNKPKVQELLSHFVLLRADLSANNESDQALLKMFSVYAPPAVLFFNTSGEEVNTHRIVGEVNANEFVSRLNTFITASCDKKINC